jgi:hypothetical protein
MVMRRIGRRKKSISGSAGFEPLTGDCHGLPARVPAIHVVSQEIMLQDRHTEQAKTNPSREYSRPSDVVGDDSVSPAARLVILKRWEQEARDLQRASDENMTGGEPSLLPDVRKAIDTLCREHGLDEYKDAPQ